MRSERSISSLTLPHLEHILVEGNQRSARSNVSPCQTVLYPICRRNSPNPTSLIESASLRLRFMPATLRSSSTTMAGRRGASATWASLSRRLMCLSLTCFATFCERAGPSPGGESFARLPFFGLTLAFGSGKEAAISALREARSSGESVARVSRLVPLCKASPRMWATRAYLRAKRLRALTRFLLPFCVRERRRCKRRRRLSSERSALGLSTARPSEHWASVLIPVSTPMGSPLAGGGSGISSATCSETNHFPASSETVAESTFTEEVGR